MEGAFDTRLVLSIIVGGGFVGLCTLAAERLGAFYGGFVAGLPSTVVVGLFFIGLIRGPEAAAAATVLIPVMVAINGLFLLTFGAMVRRGVGVAIAGSLLLWCVAAWLVLAFFPRNFVLALATCVILVAVLMVPVARGVWRIASGPPRRTASMRRVVARAVAAGMVVGGAVLGSRLGGPVIGGLLAVFPAVFTTTLTITALEHGAAFTRSMLPSLLVSGTVNIAVYAVAVRALFPVLGVWLGTLGSLVCSLFSAALTLHAVKWRAGRTD